MNIYCIVWVYDGFGLSGVVVAPNEAEAIKLMDLTYGEKDVKSHYLGVSRPDVQAHVVCREAL